VIIFIYIIILVYNNIMNCSNINNNMSNSEDIAIIIYDYVYTNLDNIMDDNIKEILDPNINKIYNKINYMNVLSERDIRARTLTMIYMGLLLVNKL
jgi:hypothetical protein